MKTEQLDSAAIRRMLDRVALTPGENLPEGVTVQ